MTRDHNPQAFPGYYGETQMQSHPGMDLRDWFAGMALQGMLANPGRLIQKPDIAAKDAYTTAAAMLAERAKGGER